MMIKRTVVWKRTEHEGLEYLTLHDDGNAVQVDSVVIGLEDQAAFRLDYHLRCDLGYVVRNLNLTVAGRVELRMTSDGQGNWFNHDGKPLTEFDGCLDLDTTATPFTNTLPIRRLQWQPGQAETFNMVYITIPDLTLRVEKQRYTCLEKTSDGSQFRYEGLSTGFTAILPVDRDGLVLDYPGLWNRVWSD